MGEVEVGSEEGVEVRRHVRVTHDLSYSITLLIINGFLLLKADRHKYFY